MARVEVRGTPLFDDILESSMCKIFPERKAQGRTWGEEQSQPGGLNRSKGWKENQFD